MEYLGIYDAIWPAMAQQIHDCAMENMGGNDLLSDAISDLTDVLVQFVADAQPETPEQARAIAQGWFSGQSRSADPDAEDEEFWDPDWGYCGGREPEAGDEDRKIYNPDP